MRNRLSEEVEKVHEKSLRLLDESHEQLGRYSEILRKTATRLAIVARGDDDQLNAVLEQIRSSVKKDIDLQELDARLDKLLVHMNQGSDSASAQAAGGFRQALAQQLEAHEAGAPDEFCRTKIHDLIDSRVPDHEMAAGLLRLVSERADGTGETAGDEAAAPTDDANKVLIELLSCLSLPEETGQDYQAVAAQLETRLDGAAEWKPVVGDIVALINKSIHVLQDEKKELESFIKKITDQLAEIEQYVWQSRQERIETANESSKLKESVDTSVDAIQNSVGSSDDIARMKSHVQGYLSEIRKSVEEHQLAEQEREEMSKQGYAHIISELTRTQKETLRLKELLQESQQKMLRDTLTGLPNRLAYEERVELEVNRSKRNSSPLCLAMWDIDHFKKVNDTYGHDAGDRVLKLLSKIIVTRIRKVDMFARIGGEEFVLLMPDTALDDALNLNDQLRLSLQDSGFHYKGEPCPITASVGIAVADELDSPDQLLKKADKALYQSKRTGRNRCTVFDNSD